MKIPQDTDTFKYYNANPKNKHTADCVIRAICTALDQSYKTTLYELTEMHMQKGYDVSDVRCFGKYLESKGFIKHKQPRKANNTKYTGKEFVKKFNGVCVAKIGAHHIVCIKDGKVLDVWNSSNECIGNYWTNQ